MLDQPPIRNLDSWSHQLEGYHRCTNRHFMLGMDMGTGKSKIVVDIIANNQIPLTIILCPVSVMGVWRREFAKHWPPNAPSLVLSILDKGSAIDRLHSIGGGAVDDNGNREPTQAIEQSDRHAAFVGGTMRLEPLRTVGEAQATLVEDPPPAVGKPDEVDKQVVVLLQRLAL